MAELCLTSGGARQIPLSPHEPPLLHQQQAKDVANTSSTTMFIEDEVHGVICLPDHINEIVEHPLFQRLKNVNQLGLIPSLRPDANHKRYDHCLGTYNSAKEHLNALEYNSKNFQPKLPNWCRNAVEIAALLHDIGHGAFSHVWECVCQGQFDHESNSVACVDIIFADVQSPELLKLREDQNGRGVQLIKALILGCKEMLTFPMLGHTYIFDIVHNRRCGLDVDKWDYLRRDNKRLGILNDKEMDFNQIFLKSRIGPDGQYIEYRYEDYHRIYRLFMARWRLHSDVYQTPKVLAMDQILKSLIQHIQPELKAVRAQDGNAWLELYDQRVFELIAKHPKSIYLRQTQRLRECSEEDAGASENIIRVQTQIHGPGKVMMPDESYPLYGDKCKKRQIVRYLMSTKINKVFQMD
ncbi:uncharacterized protein Dwil_GK20191 [Drosophila willistoni]|uniref:HD/PDEase domain-containing protein n=1 Tax=Drosophila willistoni TaxID=7260 RepID=B4MXI6_DROWI|nr:deoxynucleoside triphosphate triphosphohydrolase SAMHD1 homolog [Drosophila willistoni]EDW76755.1 uncharacterized protein Dwil_GK20191 [Drosophila willistoni]